MFEGKGLFEGFFVNGLKQGKGFYFMEKVECYQGDFKGNCKHGYGKWLSLCNFQEYEGFFQNNKKEGIGYFLGADGETYRGMFSQDRPNGTGQYSNATSKHKYKSGSIEKYGVSTEGNAAKKQQSTLRQRVELKSAQFFRGSLESS